MLARSLRLCLGVPHATSGMLVLAEPREPPVYDLRTPETCRHFFRFRAQRHEHILSTALLSRHGARLRNILAAGESLLPHNEFWRPDLHFDPWTLAIPIINMEIPGQSRKADIGAVEVKQLT